MPQRYSVKRVLISKNPVFLKTGFYCNIYIYILHQAGDNLIDFSIWNMVWQRTNWDEILIGKDLAIDDSIIGDDMGCAARVVTHIVKQCVYNMRETAWEAQEAIRKIPWRKQQNDLYLTAIHSPFSIKSMFFLLGLHDPKHTTPRLSPAMHFHAQAY